LFDALFVACSALWATLVVYGGWLCVRELALGELERTPEQDADPSAPERRKEIATPEVTR